MLPSDPSAVFQRLRNSLYHPERSLITSSMPIASAPAVLQHLRQVAGSLRPWHQGLEAIRAARGHQALSRRGLQCSASAANAAATQASPSSNGAPSKVIDIELSSEAEQSYLAYAMSVIVGRALPDVQDGLKPVHRRILYAMDDLGLAPTKPYRKCARVVGEVLGKYHPHGDSAVYDALVRMAQEFSMRAPLVSGHGNFGSLDNDPPAAMRYTECRLQSVSSAVLLADLEYDTVDFAPNFDGSQEEPRVLPARVPNLLINGSSGIAVGIATRIPPHNLREVVSGLHALIDKPDITVPELMEHIPAPDFPTGGEILASSTIREAYEHGKGPITVRGKAFIEGGDEIEEDESEASTSTDSRRKQPRRKGARDKALKPSIVITELPYQTNKSDFVATVARLVEEQKLTGISDVRDESDREGMRVVVEVKRGSSPEVVLNNLYKYTALQMRFPVNAVALVDGTPQTLSLKEFLERFLEFRCEVVRRRARFNLRKAQKRQHIVEGLLKAMHDLDKVVATIRAAKDGSAAALQLQQHFNLSPEQTDAVLGMALRRLTSLEAGKLQEEADSLKSTIAGLEQLLANEKLVLDTVKRESQEIADKFGDERRTTIRAGVSGALSEEDIVPNRPSVLVFSRKGYIKRMPADLFATQGRGGRGVTGARMRDNDTVEEVVHVMDHDTVLFFSPDGICRSLKAYQIPVSSKTAMGAPLTQVLNVGKESGLAAILNIDAFEEGDYLVMLTKKGLIKRTPLSAFTAVRPSGLTAIKLKPEDRLVWVAKCTESDSLLLGNSEGKAIRFCADDSQVPATSRVSMGVSSMVLHAGVNLVGMCVLPATLPTPQGNNSESETEDEEESGEQDVSSSGSGPTPAVLFVTQNGLGKRVTVDQFRLQKRGGVGLKSINLTEGDSLAAIQTVGVQEGASEEEMLLSTAGGRILRTPVSSIRASSRAARGALVSKLQEGDTVQAITILQPNESA